MEMKYFCCKHIFKTLERRKVKIDFIKYLDNNVDLQMILKFLLNWKPLNAMCMNTRPCLYNGNF